MVLQLLTGRIKSHLQDILLPLGSSLVTNESISAQCAWEGGAGPLT
jgi:hypothetical protein